MSSMESETEDSAYSSQTSQPSPSPRSRGKRSSRSFPHPINPSPQLHRYSQGSSQHAGESNESHSSHRPSSKRHSFPGHSSRSNYPAANSKGDEKLDTELELGAPLSKRKMTSWNPHTSSSSEDAEYVRDVKPDKDLIAMVQKSRSETDLSSCSATDSVWDSQGHGIKNEDLTTKEDVFMKYDFKRRFVDVAGLPIYKEKKMIIEEIEKNRFLIIEGATGCGKTTQVPQFIIDSCFEKNRPCNIVVTQPRKCAAKSSAQRVSNERGWELGTVVNFHYTCANTKSHPDTLLKYVTTGTLLQWLIRAKSLSGWTHIIIDEVHERDLETDLLLLLIKKILQDDTSDKAKKVKIILMSATMNTTKFSKYFRFQKPKKDKEIIDAPVIKIRTSSKYKMEEFYLDDIIKDKGKVAKVYNRIVRDSTAKIDEELNSYAVKAICGLDAVEQEERQRKGQSGSKPGELESGSVLVFLPGIAEIKELETKLNNENERIERESDKTIPRLTVLLFHSNSTKEDQENVFARPKPNQRKVILATNIAESSITIPDIVYVIDFCLTKSDCVDKRTNFNSLRTCWCSKSQCTQRKGRAGRVRDGRVYRMVPKKFFKELPVETVPAMLKSSLEKVVLKIKMLDSGRPKELLEMALDQPSTSGIERAVVNLKEVGGLKLMTTRKKDFVPNSKLVLDQREPEVERLYDSCDGDLTFLGSVMASLPLSVQCCKLIMLGFCFGVFHEALIIAASLSSTRSGFVKEKDNELECFMSRRYWSKEFQSDCIALLRIYFEWQKRKLENPNGNGLVRWARCYHINLAQMREIEDVVDDILNRLVESNEIPSVKAYIDISRSESNSGAGNSQELVAAKEISKETMLFLKLAIAGAFYPNYFVPSCRSTELELSKSVDGMDLLSTVYYGNFPRDRNGALYAKIISDSSAYAQSIPRVRFSGQKIFVSFDNSNRKVGLISEDLYRAIKKRQIGTSLELKLLGQQEEKTTYVTLRGQQRRQKEKICLCPPQVLLPSIETKSINVALGHVESPSCFWVIQQNQHEIRRYIIKAINENLLNLPVSCRFSDLEINELVLAKAPESVDKYRRYSRGRVDFTDKTLKEAQIFFIDTGHSERIPIADLQSVSPALQSFHIQGNYTATTYPALAMKCTLSETKPALMCGPEWAEDAQKTFRELKNSKFLQIRIYAVHQSVIYGEFVAHPHPSKRREKVYPVNFNEKMKSERLADRVEESFSVKRNHDARRKVQSKLITDPAKIQEWNEEQVAEAFDLDFLEPPQGGTRICKLKGPFSPLELKFQSLCRATRTADVEVNTQSVNSVCFDHRPTAPISRLLVASTINIQEKSKKLMARETTMMPLIPGILDLVSLIFTPKAELRTDSRQQKYTGALCGLGSYSASNQKDEKPVYPDHDKEVVFGVPLDDEDIHKINRIRYLMNVLLRKNDKMMNNIHEDLKHLIIELLKKPREPVEEIKRVHSPYPYQWNMIHEAFLKPPSKKDFPLEHDDVFEAHSSIIFKEAVKNYESGWGNLAC